MRRRAFVVGVSAAIASWPRWLRRAFADTSVRSAVGIAATIESARKSNRPVFAIVIPRSDEDKYTRGALWGDFLNHASDVARAPLGLADVVCAPLGDLPPAPGADERTLALVIEPSGKVTALGGLPQKLRHESDGVRFVADVVRRGLAAREPSLSPARVAELAARVNAQLVRRAPTGAHWADASMCGLETVEDMAETEVVMMDCGMGSLDETGRRFLYFFTKTPGQRWRERERSRK